jgi:hypothetical protein
MPITWRDDGTAHPGQSGSCRRTVSVGAPTAERSASRSTSPGSERLAAADSSPGSERCARRLAMARRRPPVAPESGPGIGGRKCLPALARRVDRTVTGAATDWPDRTDRLRLESSVAALPSVPTAAVALGHAQDGLVVRARLKRSPIPTTWPVVWTRLCARPHPRRGPVAWARLRRSAMSWARPVVWPNPRPGPSPGNAQGPAGCRSASALGTAVDSVA